MRSLIFQSLPEFLTYALLVLLICLNIVGLSFSIRTEQATNRILNNHSTTLNTVKNNQYSNSIALETFFRSGLGCILTAPPNIAAGTNPQKINYIDSCLPNTPEVK